MIEERFTLYLGKVEVTGNELVKLLDVFGQQITQEGMRCLIEPYDRIQALIDSLSDDDYEDDEDEDDEREERRFKCISDWMFVDYVEDEHDDKRNYTPSFWFNNRRHYIDDYVRTHNNPWLGGDFPEYIHAMESDVYVKPLFLEFSRAMEQVRVYVEA